MSSKPLKLIGIFTLVAILIAAGIIVTVFYILPNLEEQNTEILVLEETRTTTTDTETDSDGDGITDLDESDIYGTNPNKADTDGDSFDDYTEILNGYDPLVSGASSETGNSSSEFFSDLDEQFEYELTSEEETLDELTEFTDSDDLSNSESDFE